MLQQHFSTQMASRRSKRKSSFRFVILRSIKSMHILTLSTFLGTGTMLATH